MSLGLILLAELGDKTQLMVVTLSAQKESPFKIGLSASIGISCVAIIGILIGYIFSIAIPSFWIKLGGVIVFFIFGIYTLIKYKDVESQPEIQDENDGESLGYSRIKINNPYILTFLSVFLMEFGDKTQIMTITLTANYLAPIEVGLGAILALTSLCFIGAYLGELISKKISKKWINIGAGIFFIVMGLIILIELIFNIKFF
ncbi:MAG: TMEM165/GDT1 family protein [Promethearchaeota archaeon]